MWNWRAIFSADIDQIYRKSFLRDDINQARTIIAIVAAWVLGYIYADYLELGPIKTFYLLLLLRVMFFGASVGIFFRMVKVKNVNLVDSTVLAWNTALVTLALLANASHDKISAEDIMVHYILILGFYLLVPNRLFFRVLPSFIVTAVDICILTSCIRAAGTNFTGSNIFTDIIILVALNTLGVLLAIRSDTQRAKHFLIQKTLIDGRAQLKELATTDALTGILNRRSFLDAAEIQFDRFKRYQENFSLVIVDLDQLKSINDTFGHPAGDHAIRLLTGTMITEKRSSDMIGRLAGDEFGLILPNTSADKALEVLSRIKNNLAETIVETPTGQQFQVRFSAGVTGICKSEETFDELYRRADKALLSAKQSGRNSIKMI
jgi:diguanylate cyclase (GGDEF)-like protein